MNEKFFVDDDEVVGSVNIVRVCFIQIKLK